MVCYSARGPSDSPEWSKQQGLGVRVSPSATNVTITATGCVSSDANACQADGSILADSTFDLELYMPVPSPMAKFGIASLGGNCGNSSTFALLLDVNRTVGDLALAPGTTPTTLANVSLTYGGNYTMCYSSYGGVNFVQQAIPLTIIEVWYAVEADQATFGSAATNPATFTVTGAGFGGVNQYFCQLRLGNLVSEVTAASVSTDKVLTCAQPRWEYGATMLSLALLSKRSPSSPMSLVTTPSAGNSLNFTAEWVSISPSEGDKLGGTVVTVHGYGFSVNTSNQPGMYPAASIKCTFNRSSDGQSVTADAVVVSHSKATCTTPEWSTQPWLEYDYASNGTTVLSLSAFWDDGSTEPVPGPAALVYGFVKTNHPPSFGGSNLDVTNATIGDDGVYSFPNWAGTIHKGIKDGVPVTDEEHQTVSFEVEAVVPSVFSEQPLVDQNGTLTFVPFPERTGPVRFKVWAIDSDEGTSPVKTFTITLRVLDQAAAEPEISLIDELSVWQNSEPTTVVYFAAVEAWSTGLSAADDSLLTTLSFEVTFDSELFDTEPAIDEEGTLTFQPAKGYYGDTSVRYRLKSSNNQATRWANVTIHVLYVNQAPTFKLPSPAGQDSGAVSTLEILENSGPYNAPFATDLSRGYFPEAAEEGGVGHKASTPSFRQLEDWQNWTFSVEFVSGDEGMMLVQPQVDAATGNITFEPRSDKYGLAEYRLTMTDNGGVERGGIDSSSEIFVINVVPINSRPSFSIPLNAVVEESSTALERTFEGFASFAKWNTSFAGPGDEASEQVTFLVELVEGSLAMFEDPPQISSNGLLSFTPGAYRWGNSTFNVTIFDSGGTENGGINSGRNITGDGLFVIDVLPINNAPTIGLPSTIWVWRNSYAEAPYNPPDMMVLHDCSCSPCPSPNCTSLSSCCPALVPAGTTATVPTLALVSPGPFEPEQQVNFRVSSTTLDGFSGGYEAQAVSLFSGNGPYIFPNGTIHLSLNPSATGRGRLSVSLSDTGGKERGGLNTSSLVVELLVLAGYVQIDVTIPSGSLTTDELREVIATHLGVAVSSVILLPPSAAAAAASSRRLMAGSTTTVTVQIVSTSVDSLVVIGSNIASLGASLPTGASASGSSFLADGSGDEVKLSFDMPANASVYENAREGPGALISAISLPGSTLSASGRQEVDFTVEVLGYRAPSTASNWTAGDALGEIFASPPTVTASCMPLCGNATLALNLTDKHGIVEMNITLHDPVDTSRSVTKTLFLTIMPVGDAPFVRPGYASGIHLLEDGGPCLVPECTLNTTLYDLYDIFGDADMWYPDADSLSVNSSDPDRLAVQIIGNGTTLSITPGIHVWGSFNLTAIDASGLKSFTPVSVIIQHVNHAPYLTQSAPNYTIQEDNALDSIDFAVFIGEVDGDDITYAVESLSPWLLNAYAASGMLFLRPLFNINGAGSVRIHATDTSGAVLTVVVNVTVTPVPDAPIAIPEALAVTTWFRTPGFLCKRVPSTQGLIPGTISLEACKVACLAVDSCVALTYYAYGDSRCYITEDICEQIPSTSSATIHTRPVGVVVNENSEPVFIDASHAFGDYDECDTMPPPAQNCTREGDNITLSISSSNETVVLVSVNESGMVNLTFVSWQHTYGYNHVVISLIATDSYGAASNLTFNVTILSVNNPPVAVHGGDIYLWQGQGTSGMGSAGSVNVRTFFGDPGDSTEPTFFDHDEVDGDRLTVSAMSDDPLLMSVNVDSSSYPPRLIITVASDQFGVGNLTVTATDKVGQTASTVLIVRVRMVNRPPRFTISQSSWTQDESIDDELSYIPNFVSFDSAGTSSEDVCVRPPVNPSDCGVAFGGTGQQFTFDVAFASGLATLMAVQPMIGPDGTLSFAARPLTRGSANYSVFAFDDSGEENGGASVSPATTFTINVEDINFEPLFDLIPTLEYPPSPSPPVLRVLQNSNSGPGMAPGMHSIQGFAWNIDRGGGGSESDQAITFNLTMTWINETDLFIIEPAISIDGTLTFQLRPDYNGAAKFELYLEDDGGDKGDTKLRSELVYFDLVVTAVNMPPTMCFITPSGEEAHNLTLTEDSPVSLVDFVRVSAGGSLCSDLEPYGLCNSSTTPTVCGRLLPRGAEANQTLNLTVVLSEGPCSPFNCTDPLFPPLDAYLSIHLNGTGSTLTAFACNDGIATVNLTLEDSGGASITRQLVVPVETVNDRPEFTLNYGTVYMLEDSVSAIDGLASGVNPGRCEGNQTVQFELQTVEYWVPWVPGSAEGSGDAPGGEQLFTAPLKLFEENGTLAYVLNPDRNGRFDLKVRLVDDGQGAGGETSALERNLTIYVLPVNDEPHFDFDATLLANGISVSEDGGETSRVDAAENIIKGGWGEELQKVIFSFDLIEGPERLFVPLFIVCDGTEGWGLCSDGTGDFKAIPRPRRNGKQVVRARITDDGRAPTWPIDSSGPPFELLTHGDLGAPAAVGTYVLNSTLTLTVTAVDNKPRFRLASPIVKVLQDSGCVSAVPHWDGLDGAACNRSIRGSHMRAGFVKHATMGDSYEDGVQGCPNIAWLSEGTSNSCINQTGTYTVAPADPESASVAETLFSRMPDVSPDGSLRFRLAQYQYGTANFTISLKDSNNLTWPDVGSGDEPVVFSLVVIDVNDPPSFRTPERVIGWEGKNFSMAVISNVSGGRGEPVPSVENFTITVADTSIFTPGGQPRLLPGGILQFTPLPLVFGETLAVITLRDGDGTMHHGRDTSDPVEMTIRVENVNGRPSFKAPDLLVFEGMPSYLHVGHATDLSAGPDNENGICGTFPGACIKQNFEFSFVGASNPSLFAPGPPALVGEGDLRFSTCEGCNGFSEVTFTLRDDAGTRVELPDCNATCTSTSICCYDPDQPVGEDSQEEGITFGIYVEPVDTRPSFRLPWQATCTSVLQDAPPCTCPGLDSAFVRFTAGYDGTRIPKMESVCALTDDDDDDEGDDSAFGGGGAGGGGGVSVLEDSGLQTLSAFASSISVHAGHLPYSVAHFGSDEISITEPNGTAFEYLGRQPDYIGRLPELSFDVDVAFTGPDAALTIGHETNQITSWMISNASTSEPIPLILDRRSNGDRRLRFTGFGADSASAQYDSLVKPVHGMAGACSALTVVGPSGGTNVVVAAGCQDINASTHLAVNDTAVGDDAWDDVMGHWDLTTSSMYRREGDDSAGMAVSKFLTSYGQKVDCKGAFCKYFRSKRNDCETVEMFSTQVAVEDFGKVVREDHPTQIGPATIRNEKAGSLAMGAAVMTATGIACKERNTDVMLGADFDVPVNESLSTVSLVASADGHEAMQFDPQLYSGLFITDDIDALATGDPLTSKLPTKAMSIEAFVATGTASDGEIKPIFSTSSIRACEPEVEFGWPGYPTLPPPCGCQKGWDLTWSYVESFLIFRFSLSVQANVDNGNVGNGKGKYTVLTIELDRVVWAQQWAHIVGTYDGTNMHLHVSGAAGNASVSRPACTAEEGEDCGDIVYAAMYNICGLACECPDVCPPDRVHAPTGRCYCGTDGCYQGTDFPEMYKTAVAIGYKAQERNGRLERMTHTGLIRTVRVYKRAVSQDAARARYLKHYQAQAAFPYTPGRYWARSTGEKHLTPPAIQASLVEPAAYPSRDTAEVDSLSAGLNFTVAGNFSIAGGYKARFTTPGGGAVETECSTPFEADPHGHPYASKMTCSLPTEWNQGHKGAHLSILEPLAAGGYATLWSRICIAAECGYWTRNFEEMRKTRWYLPAVSTTLVTNDAATNSTIETVANETVYGLGLSGTPSIVRFVIASSVHVFNAATEEMDFQSKLANPASSSAVLYDPMDSPYVGAASHGITGLTRARTLLESNGDMYLLQASQFDGVGLTIRSNVMRVGDPVSFSSFSTVQRVPAVGAMDWAVMDISGVRYVAVAQYGSTSKIYRWVGKQPVTSLTLADAGYGYIDGDMELSGTDTAGASRVSFTVDDAVSQGGNGTIIQPLVPADWGNFLTDIELSVYYAGTSVEMSGSITEVFSRSDAHLHSTGCVTQVHTAVTVPELTIAPVNCSAGMRLVKVGTKGSVAQGQFSAVIQAVDADGSFAPSDLIVTPGYVDGGAASLTVQALGENGTWTDASSTCACLNSTDPNATHIVALDACFDLSLSGAPLRVVAKQGTGGGGSGFEAMLTGSVLHSSGYIRSSRDLSFSSAADHGAEYMTDPELIVEQRISTGPDVWVDSAAANSCRCVVDGATVSWDMCLGFSRARGTSFCQGGTRHRYSCRSGADCPGEGVCTSSKGAVVVPYPLVDLPTPQYRRVFEGQDPAWMSSPEISKRVPVDTTTSYDIPVVGAAGLATFNSGGAVYLCVSLYYDVDSQDLARESVMYRVSPAPTEVARISVVGSRDVITWEMSWLYQTCVLTDFGVDSCSSTNMTATFVAFAGVGTSKLARWDEQTQELLHVQDLAVGERVRSMSTMEHSGAQYLLVSQDGNSSMLLRWNGTRFLGLLDKETMSKDTAGGQLIPASDAVSMLPVKSAGIDYLVAVQAGAEAVSLLFRARQEMSVRGMELPISLALSPGQGQFVYVACHGSGSIVVFERPLTDDSRELFFHDSLLVDSDDGVDLSGIFAITVRGNHLYSVNSIDGGGAMHVFDIDLATGQLTEQASKRRSSLGMGGARALFVDHGIMYVAGAYDQAVSVLTVDEASGVATYEDHLRNGERSVMSMRMHVNDSVAVADEVIPGGGGNASTLPFRIGGRNRDYSMSARTVRTFEIDGREMVVLSAGTEDGTGGLLVLEWVNSSMEVVQELSQEGAATDVAHLKHKNNLDDDNGWDFLVVTSFGSTHPGRIYRWNPGRHLFFLFTSLPEVESSSNPIARRAQAFTIEEQDFLAIAAGDAIYIYKWQDYGITNVADNTTARGIGFETFQKISTNSSYDVDVSCASTDAAGVCTTVLLHAAILGVPSVPGYVEVHRYSASRYNDLTASQGAFELSSKIEGFSGAVSGATSFSIGDVHYVAVAAYSRGPSVPAGYSSIGTAVYSWSGSAYQLVQQLDAFSSVSSGSDRWGVSSSILVGASHVSFFEWQGEAYLCISQGVCDHGDACTCTSDITGMCEAGDQPQATVLQWDSAAGEFGEMLAMTDAAEARLKGRSGVPDAERYLHRQALRIPAGQGRHSTFAVLGGLPLLMVSSGDRGALAFEFSFEEVVGMRGLEAVAAIDNQTAYAAGSSDGALVAVRRGEVYDALGAAYAKVSMARVWSDSPLNLSRTVFSEHRGIEGLRGARRIERECGGSSEQGTWCKLLIHSSTFNDERFCTGSDYFPPNLDVFSAQASVPLPCQSLTFSVSQLSTTDPGLFRRQPYLYPNGTLVFEANPQKSGTAVFEATLKDDGLEWGWTLFAKTFGYTLGNDGSGGDSSSSSIGTRTQQGNDTSHPQIFTITVLNVNDPPSFAPVDVGVLSGAGPSTLVFGVNVTAGAGADGMTGSEAEQTVRVESWEWVWELIPGAVCPDAEEPDNVVVDLSLLPDAALEKYMRECKEACLADPECAYVEVYNPGTPVCKLSPLSCVPETPFVFQQFELTYYNLYYVPRSEFVTQPTVAISPPGPMKTGPRVGIVSFEALANTYGTFRILVTLADDGGADPLLGSQNVSASTEVLIRIFSRNSEPSYDSVFDSVTMNSTEGRSFSRVFAQNMSAGVGECLCSAFACSDPDFGCQDVSFRLDSVTTLSGGRPSSLALFENFAVDPTTGLLEFTVSTHWSGLFRIGVRLEDSGDAIKGGADVGGVNSTLRFFELEYTILNELPRFTPVANFAVAQSSEATPSQSFVALEGLTAGSGDLQFEVDYDPLVTLLEINCSNPVTGPVDCETLFEQGPIFYKDGSFSFTQATAQYGEALMLIEVGNTAPYEPPAGGFARLVVTLTIEAVNQPPTCDFLHPVFVGQDAGPHEVRFFATNLQTGPPSESWQHLVFPLTAASDPTDLFISPPVIDPDGTLLFHAAEGRFGKSTISVSCRDNGGTLFGGVDARVGGVVAVDISIVPSPVVLRVVPGFGLVSGGNTVTVVGRQFGSALSRGYSPPLGGYSHVRVLIGGKPCASSRILSDSEILCSGAPQGNGASDATVEINDPAWLNPIVPTMSVAGTLKGAYSYQSFFAVGTLDDAGAQGFIAIGSYTLKNMSAANPTSDAAAQAQSAAQDGVVHARGRVDVRGLGMQGAVRAVSAIGGLVYFGGSFRAPSGAGYSSHIAVWDNTGPPRSVANGVDGSVDALARHRTVLVAGGTFTTAFPLSGRPVPCGGLVYFDPATDMWGIIGKAPLLGAVRAVLSHNDTLFVGGLIATHNGAPAGHIMAHTGPVDRAGGWVSIGGVQGDGAYVSAIEALGSEVVVGGSFSSAGGLAAANIARWDGGHWHRLLDQDCTNKCRFSEAQNVCAELVCDLDGHVTALAVTGPSIFAAGGFSVAGGKMVNGLAQYTKGMWYPLGEGVVGGINVLGFMPLSVPRLGLKEGTLDGACLYVGGQFHAVGAENIQNLAQFCFDESSGALGEGRGRLEQVPSVGSPIGRVHGLMKGVEVFGQQQGE